MAFLAIFKHDANVKHGADVVRHERSRLQPPPPGGTQHHPSARGQPSQEGEPETEPEPERDLLTKLIAGSGHHHHHHHSHSRHSSYASSSGINNKDSNNNHTSAEKNDRLLALTQREAELRYQLDLLTKEKTETEGYFATLRARFDAEAEWDKNEAHTAETPGVFWERFAAGEEMERRREGVMKRERELREELESVVREKAKD